MVFRPDRSHRSGPDPTLHLRILLFCFGAGCAIAGIYFGVSWLITVGILVLAAGVLLRLIGERRRRDAREAAWREQADAEGASVEATADTGRPAMDDAEGAAAEHDAADDAAADTDAASGEPPARGAGDWKRGDGP